MTGMTDKKYEKGTNVKKAIAAGKLKRVSSVEGAYRVSDTIGISGCHVTFTIAKAYRGIHEDPVFSRNNRGIYVKFIVSMQDECRCKSLGLIQVLRTIVKEADDSIDTADPATRDRRKLSGWSDDGRGPVPGQASPGWRVDVQLGTDDVPYYQPQNVGKAGTPAELWDVPSHGIDDRDIGLEFYTAAICIREGEQGSVMGVLHWQFMISDDDAGSILIEPAPEAIKRIPAQFRDAVRRWESVTGKSANIAFD